MRWKEVRLGDICQMNSGGTPSRKKADYYGGEIFWAKISDIEKAKSGIISETEEKITNEGLKAINNRIFEKDTLLLAMYGSVGKTAITGCKLSCNQAILGIRPIDNNTISLKYLKFWFLRKKADLLNRAVGGTLQNISLGIVKSLQIPLPDLPTQQHIAAVLDKADALRQQNQQLLTYYDELLQGTFIELFGDPVTNEKGWEKTELLDIAIEDGIKCGPFGSQLHAEEFMHEGVPLWGIKQVNKHFEIPTKEFLSEKKARELSKYSIEPFDIVMTRKGTIGNCAVYPKRYPKGVMHSDLLRIRVNEEKCAPIFLSNQLRYSDDIIHQISLISSGAIMAGINVGKLKRIKVLLPPVFLQNQFAEVVERIEAQKAQVQAALAESEVLFEGLLAGYFGENQIETKGSNPGPPTSQLRLF